MRGLGCARDLRARARAQGGAACQEPGGCGGGVRRLQGLRALAARAHALGVWAVAALGLLALPACDDDPTAPEPEPCAHGVHCVCLRRGPDGLTQELPGTWDCYREAPGCSCGECLDGEAESWNCPPWRVRYCRDGRWEPKDPCRLYR